MTQIYHTEEIGGTQQVDFRLPNHFFVSLSIKGKKIQQGLKFTAKNTR